MAKELYIYSPLYDFTAERVVEQLNSISNDEDLTIRINTPGGNVSAGWAIISKLSERTGKTKAIIDGDAASMGAIMLIFFDDVIANDTSSIMFHKAAYSSYYKPSEQEMQKLKTINAQFKEKIGAKVAGKEGAEDFMNKLFEADVRNDIELTPAKAMKLGIVKEIKKLTPTAYDFNMQVVAIAETKKEINTPSGENNNHSKTKTMDLVKLKAEYPAVYQAAFAEGRTEGISVERDRAEAWAVYIEVNPEKVKAGIEGGKELSGKAMAELNLEIAKGGKVEALKLDNEEKVIIPVEKETEAQAQARKDNEQLDKELGTIKAY